MYSPALIAQDPPITWGNIPKEDLEMKSFPADTNASALILCDYGETFLNDDLHLEFKRHLRVKILSAKGYELGTKSIILYTEEDTERIFDIEGVTYLLTSDGQIEKKELDDDDIFEEKVDDQHTRYRFTLPGLQPGCIIEIRYTIEANSLWFVRDWTFQHNEPVRWSEYRLRNPEAIAFASVCTGYESFTLNEKSYVQQMFSGQAASYLGKKIVQCVQMRWAVQNLPALRDEPYITTIEDYMNKVSVQLSGYAFYYGGSKKVLNTWDSLVQELIDSELFYKKIDATKSIREKASEITTGLTTPEEKLKALYRWVSNSIVWSEERVFAKQDIDDVLDSKKGNNAEITFLLLSLLKSIEIPGDPIIVSTRSNGKIQSLYPIISQFNYVLARVNIGSQIYFIDATDPLRPIELLPTKVLNVQGLVIKKDAWEWITITSPRGRNVSAIAKLKLHEDGTVMGLLEEAYRDYAGLSMRRELREKSEIEVAKTTFETEQTGITLDSISFGSKDSISAPLFLKTSITANNYAISNGDLLYINPHIINRIRDNPFKTVTRKFPVDYSYRRINTTVVQIDLPNDFEVKEPIPNRSYTLGQDLAQFNRNVELDTHQVRILYKLFIRETEIKPKFYSQLREFYNQIIAAESEQLVLSRKKPPPETIQSTPPPVKSTKKKAKK
jgi:hypothetical protein